MKSGQLLFNSPVGMVFEGPKVITQKGDKHSRFRGYKLRNRDWQAKDIVI